MSAADLDDLLLPTTTPPSSTTPHARLAAAEDQTALALGVLVLVLLVSVAPPALSWLLGRRSAAATRAARQGAGAGDDGGWRCVPFLQLLLIS